MNLCVKFHWFFFSKFSHRFLLVFCFFMFISTESMITEWFASWNPIDFGVFTVLDEPIDLLCSDSRNELVYWEKKEEEKCVLKTVQFWIEKSKVNLISPFAIRWWESESFDSTVYFKAWFPLFIFELNSINPFLRFFFFYYLNFCGDLGVNFLDVLIFSSLWDLMRTRSIIAVFDVVAFQI